MGAGIAQVSAVRRPDRGAGGSGGAMAAVARGEPCGQRGPFPACCSCVPGLCCGSSPGAEPGRGAALRAVPGWEGTSSREGERSAGGPALIKPTAKLNNLPGASQDVLQAVFKLLRDCLPRLCLCGKQWLRRLSAGLGGTRPCACLARVPRVWAPLLLRSALLAQLSHFCC